MIEMPGEWQANGGKAVFYRSGRGMSAVAVLWRQMEPMIEQVADHFAALPDEYLVDGGFSSREDTTRLEQRGVKVYSPVKKEQTLLEQGDDPYARRRGDTDEYYAFRQRMKTPQAKEIDRDRCSTAEFPNAGCRNRGFQQFPLRGLKKTRSIALWHALVHNFSDACQPRLARNLL